MTLDKDLPRRERRRRRTEAGREWRQSYNEELKSRRPWLFPLLVGGAVVIIAAVLVYWLVTGAFS